MCVTDGFMDNVCDGLGLDGISWWFGRFDVLEKG
jgi:hypothetical protein